MAVALFSMASIANAGLPSSIYAGQSQQQPTNNPYTGPADSMLNQQIQLYNYEQRSYQYQQDQYDRALWRLWLQNHWNDRR